jgi:hypothetical protein
MINLIVMGYTPIASVYNIEERPVHSGRITFPWGNIIEAQLISCELQDMDCLIGRDVLKKWLLICDGVNGEITICD